MPRYFQSIVTGRPLEVGGRSFIFEPVEPMGGSWAGVLAVDDESAANILANAGLEITEAVYNRLKKKLPIAETVQGFVPSQTPQLPPQPIVVSAVRAEDRTSFSSKIEEVKPATSVSLSTTNKKPPFDPLLENITPKRRKVA